MKLDRKTVAVLPLTQDAHKADVLYFDDGVPGFALRCRRSGDRWRRTWILQYRKGAKQRRYKLGDADVIDPERARKLAISVSAEAAKPDVDPQAAKHKERSRQVHAFSTLVEDFLATKRDKLRPLSYADLSLYLQRRFPRLQRLDVGQITRRDVSAEVERIAREHGATSSARAFSAIAGMFSWAVGTGRLDASPIIGLKRPAEPPPRDRVLEAGEIAEIWQACGPDGFGAIVKLLILTSQRRGEVGGMRWSELDLAGAIWRLPPGRVKNKQAHEVALSDPVLAIIAAVPKRAGRDLLFGDSASGFVAFGVSKPVLDARILANRRAAAEAAGQDADSVEPMTPWRLHDLRRTAVTGMCDLGVLPHVVETIVNHTSGHKAGVVATYNKSLYRGETRKALALWADHVLALVGKRKRKLASIAA